MKLITVPFGRHHFTETDQTYELDRSLEVYDGAPAELNFVVQWLMDGEWIVSVHLNCHWNAVRLAVIQALAISQVPVVVYTIGGVCVDIQDGDDYGIGTDDNPEDPASDDNRFGPDNGDGEGFDWSSVG